jgi:sugar lactone lactonase YvrE
VIDRRVHPWGIELTGFGRPFGLAIDRTGRLHVTDMDRHHIVRFDAGFERHDVLGSDGLWNGPHSVDFASDGSGIVTCYYTPGIYPLATGEQLHLERGLTGPASAFFTAAGRLIVAEYSQNAVLEFEVGGRLIRTFNGRFDRPHMAREQADGTVLVADTWNNRLQRFDPDGVLIDDEVAQVPCPVAIDSDSSRGLLVTAWADNDIVRFDSEGRPAGRLHCEPLHKPYDARWLADDRVAIADSHHARVLILTAPRFH